MAEQDVELKRQFERWVSPYKLMSADERRERSAAKRIVAALLDGAEPSDLTPEQRADVEASAHEMAKTQVAAERRAAAARLALRQGLLEAATEVAREQVRADSATWATRDNLDDYIRYAMEHEQRLYAPAAGVGAGATDPHECIAGVTRLREAA